MKGDISFGKVFGDSWDIFVKKFGLLASLGFLFLFLPTIVFEVWNKSRVSYLVKGVAPSLGDIFMEAKAVAPWSFGLWIVSLLFVASAIYALNNGKKKKSVDFVSAIKGGWSFYGKVFLLELVLFIFLIPLYLLFIIPGIVFQVYWTFAVYILIAEKSSIMDSLKKSYALVKDKWWLLFGYLLLFFIMIGAINVFSDALFGKFELVGVFVLEGVVSTLVSIFSLVFINTLYLAYKK